MVSIGSTSVFESALVGLAKTGKSLAKTSSQLATGKRVQSGSDDPVALQSINQMSAAIRGLEVANSNISSASSMLNVAQGSLSNVNATLQDLRSIAVQAADGTLSASDRNNLVNQANNLLGALGDISNQANYGGVNLLDGSFGSRDVQIGANEGETLTISIDSASPTALGVDSIDLSDATTSGNAITTIDNAISSVITQQASIGATQSRLDVNSSINETQSISLYGSKSNLEDIDYASALTDLMKLEIQHQAQINVLKVGLENEKGKLSLLA